MKASEDDGEGGGGEPAVNGEEPMEEVKQFSLKTVHNDDKEIRGYLYKTAQSVGFM